LFTGKTRGAGGQGLSELNGGPPAEGAAALTMSAFRAGVAAASAAFAGSVCPCPATTV
jgi:hypothetical protein